MDPRGTQRAHADLLANPPPIPGIRINVRTKCHRASRLVRENGVIGGLTKCRIAEVWKGRGDWLYSQGAGGFPKRRGPIRSLTMGATHLYDLAQEFLRGLPGIIARARWIAICAPLF